MGESKPDTPLQILLFSANTNNVVLVFRIRVEVHCLNLLLLVIVQLNFDSLTQRLTW